MNRTKVDIEYDDGSVVPNIDRQVALGLIRDMMQEKLLNVGDSIGFRICVSYR